MTGEQLIQLRGYMTVDEYNGNVLRQMAIGDLNYEITDEFEAIGVTESCYVEITGTVARVKNHPFDLYSIVVNPDEIKVLGKEEADFTLPLMKSQHDLESCLAVKQELNDENTELQEGIETVKGWYDDACDSMLLMAYGVGEWVYAEGTKGRIAARSASSYGVTYDIEFINDNGIVWGTDTYVHADCKPDNPSVIDSLNDDISRLRRELEEAHTALSNEMRMRASVEHRADHMAKLLKEEGDFSLDRLRKLRLANQWSMAWKKAARDYRERYQIALESLEVEREWRDSYQPNGESHD